MKIFVIRNEEDKTRKNLAYLIYYEKDKRFRTPGRRRHLGNTLNSFFPPETRRKDHKCILE